VWVFGAGQGGALDSIPSTTKKKRARQVSWLLPLSLPSCVDFHSKWGFISLKDMDFNQLILHHWLSASPHSSHSELPFSSSAFSAEKQERLRDLSEVTQLVSGRTRSGVTWLKVLGEYCASHVPCPRYWSAALTPVSDSSLFLKGSFAGPGRMQAAPRVQGCTQLR
jgi:hypothetical protein